MRKLIAYSLVGASVGIVAAVVGNQLMPNESYADLVSARGLDAAKLYDLKKAYEIVGYFLLGSLLASIVATLANSERTQGIKNRSFIVGLVLGGPLCAGANALINLICLSMARHYSADLILNHQQSSTIHDAGFLLHYALIPTSLAIAITVAVGINGFTIQRGLISAALASVISGITIHLLFFIIAPIMIASALGSGGMGHLDVSALLKPLLIAHMLGMGLGAAVAFGVVQILYRAAWLTGLNGWLEGKHLPIPAPVAVLGSRHDINMVLPADGTVAPAHAQIDSTEERHLIRPVMGQVLVNGSPVQEAWLADNDVVEIGAFKFRYRNRLPSHGSSTSSPEPAKIVMPIASPPAPDQLTLEDSMGGVHILRSGTIIIGSLMAAVVLRMSA